jgi:hypothetical protein
VNTTSLLDSTNYYLPHLERAFRIWGRFRGRSDRANGRRRAPNSISSSPERASTASYPRPSAAAWKETNRTLREWFQAAPGNEWARLLLPDRILDWLAMSASDDRWLLVTLYPLAAMVVTFLVVIPMVRGLLQSRVARRAAVVSVTERAREAYTRTATTTKRAGEVWSTGYSTLRERARLARRAPRG